MQPDDRYNLLIDRIRNVLILIMLAETRWIVIVVCNREFRRVVLAELIG